MANPVIVGVDGDSITYNELSGAVPISPDASVTDGDLTDFENGVLTVTFAGGASGVNDRLTLINSPAIKVDEGTIYDAADFIIGFVSGGNDPTAPLVVTFTVDADAADVGEVVKAVSFANGSGDPTAGVRNLDFVLTDGDGGTSDTVTATVDVVAVDDAPVAIADQIYAIDNAVRFGSVFADNGFGNDFDFDGPPIAVTAVNGNAALVGVEFTLASGAKLKVNADGTFSYNPNGQFEYLISEEKAFLTNTVYFGPFDDGFTYEISGSASASVTVTVMPVDGTGDELHGDSGNGIHHGTTDPDLFILDEGGNDLVSGGEGDDQFHFGAEFTSADRVVGDAGEDSVILRGNYALVFQADDLAEVERIVLDSESGDSWDYALTMADENVAAGQQLQIDATRLQVDQSLIFVGSAESDGAYEVLAGSGNDLMTGGGGGDVMSGGIGEDRLFGLGGHDQLDGGSAPDRLVGGDGDDRLDGGRGHDSLEGGDGNDILLGGDHGIDRLDGGTGADTMTGGVDNDTYVVDNAGDIVIELRNQGNDRVESTISYDLPAHLERLFLMGSHHLVGRGNALDNKLFGNAGKNFLNGGGGDDVVDGGAGSDRIYGSEGHDVLIGGAGNDRFHFNTALGPGNVDRIIDYAPGQDTLYLARYAFAGVGPHGTLGAGAFVQGSSAGDASDRILYDQATGDIFYDGDGSGAASAILFATVNAGTPLTHSDFFVYS